MQRWLMPLFVVAALAAGLLAGLWVNKPVDDSVITVLQTPRPVRDFALTAETGANLTTEQLRGQWTLVFAGFKNCPDICPDTLARMAALRAKSPAVAERVSMLFVSVDPQRDTPEQLDAYTDHFDPAITGATGDKAQIDQLMADLGLAYLLVPLGEDASDAYTVDHSAALVLLDPQARVAAYLSPPHDVDAMATALKKVTS